MPSSQRTMTGGRRAKPNQSSPSNHATSKLTPAKPVQPRKTNETFLRRSQFTNSVRSSTRPSRASRQLPGEFPATRSLPAISPAERPNFNSGSSNKAGEYVQSVASSRASCVKPEPPRAITAASSLRRASMPGLDPFLAQLNSRKIRFANSQPHDQSCSRSRRKVPGLREFVKDTIRDFTLRSRSRRGSSNQRLPNPTPSEALQRPPQRTTNLPPASSPRRQHAATMPPGSHHQPRQGPRKPWRKGPGASSLRP